MHPFLFSIGDLPISTYEVAMTLAFCIATLMAYRRAPKEGLDRGVVLDTCLWIVIGSLLGARILFILTTLPDYLADPIKFLKIWEGGLVYYGGLLGGVAAMWLFLRRRRRFEERLAAEQETAKDEGPPAGDCTNRPPDGAKAVPPLDRAPSFMAVADLIAPYLMLGLAIHRAGGCFMSGCCFGRPTDLPWGVTFPLDSAPAYEFGGRPVHPTQLYESIAGLAIAALLLFWRSRKRFAGELTCIVFVLYPIFRFAVEFVRGDKIRGHVGPLSTSQVVSIVLVGLAAVWFVRARRASGAPGQGGS